MACKRYVSGQGNPQLQAVQDATTKEGCEERNAMDGHFSYIWQPPEAKREEGTCMYKMNAADGKGIFVRSFRNGDRRHQSKASCVPEGEGANNVWIPSSDRS